MDIKGLRDTIKYWKQHKSVVRQCGLIVEYYLDKGQETVSRDRCQEELRFVDPFSKPDSLESHSVESVPDATGYPSDMTCDADWVEKFPFGPNPPFQLKGRGGFDSAQIIKEWRSYPERYTVTVREGAADDGPEVDILRVIGRGISLDVAAFVLEAINRYRKEPENGQRP